MVDGESVPSLPFLITFVLVFKENVWPSSPKLIPIIDNIASLVTVALFIVPVTLTFTKTEPCEPKSNSPSGIYARTVLPFCTVKYVP